MNEDKNEWPLNVGRVLLVGSVPVREQTGAHRSCIYDLALGGNATEGQVGGDPTRRFTLFWQWKVCS